MAIKVKAQKNYYLSEISIELPTDFNAVSELMKELKSTGRVVTTFNQGGAMMVNVEQKTKIPPSLDPQVREIIGIVTRTYNGAVSGT
jgi:hypothetical protein